MSNLYFPVAGTGTAPTPAAMHPATALSDMVRIASQRAYILQVDIRLVEAAAAHALDMATSNYFAHESPAGSTANERAKAAGFPLPHGAGNDIESIAAHDSGPYAKPEVVFEGLMRSDAHRAHLVGYGRFGTLDRIGVGYAYNAASDFKHYYVVLIAKEG